MGLNKRLISTAAAGGVVNTENFAPVLYSGNGSTQSINVGFAADLVFIKNRTVGQGWSVWDTVRGAYSGYLETQNTNAELNPQNMLTFDSDGFNVSTNGGAYTQTNRSSSGDQYVSFSWKAGGAAVSNTNGSITSTVSANPDAGFSIVSYSGNQSASTIGHGLSSAPEMIIAKSRSVAQNWAVYHKDAGNQYWLQLNGTTAKLDEAIWNDTTPTDSVFSINGNVVINANGSTNIAYCFHSVDGYQKIGSYTGTGQPNNDVTTGFKPRWVMIKSTAAQGWNIVDSVRNPSNPANLNIQANTSDAESSTANPAVQVDFDDTGFSLVAPAGTPGEGQVNSNGATYIYLAIA